MWRAKRGDGRRQLVDRRRKAAAAGGDKCGCVGDREATGGSDDEVVVSRENVACESSVHRSRRLAGGSLGSSRCDHNVSRRERTVASGRSPLASRWMLKILQHEVLHRTDVMQMIPENKPLIRRRRHSLLKQSGPTLRLPAGVRVRSTLHNCHGQSGTCKLDES